MGEDVSNARVHTSYVKGANHDRGHDRGPVSTLDNTDALFFHSCFFFKESWHIIISLPCNVSIPRRCIAC